MRTKDPSVRMALKLQRILHKRHINSDANLMAAVEVALDQARQLDRQVSLYLACRRRNWSAAGRAVQERLIQVLQEIKASTAMSLSQIQVPPPVTCPKLRDLCDELCQLADEFPQISLDLKTGIIAVETGPIVLEDENLGEFRLELNLNRLVNRCDSAVFDVIALDPHPASSNPSVVHPHVQDQKVCAGDGATTIASALKEGRLADAFLALHAILSTYNGSSAYVSLESWHGIVCADCGSTEDTDNSFFCDACSSTFCRDCYGFCDLCDNSFCHSCLQEDEVSGRTCCPSCRYECEHCGRIVDAGHFNQSTSLCPACHIEQEEQVLEEMTVVSQPIQANIQESINEHEQAFEPNLPVGGDQSRENEATAAATLESPIPIG